MIFNLSITINSGEVHDEANNRRVNSYVAADGTEADPVETWVSEQILAPEDVRREMSTFVKQRIPPLSCPDTPEAWQRQSEELRQKILDEVVFRGVPKEWVNWKAEAVWGDTLQTDKGYRIRKLRYEALPGLWIPALLYEPTEVQENVPAILNVNGHVGPIGKAIGYEQLRCINLAKKGVLALHPEWLVFGELSGEDYKHNRLAYLDLCGMSGLSVFYLAMRGGLDVLVDYPTTDQQRVGMTGLSGGGWQTIILSALDTRISLAVPNAGYIDLHNRIAHRSDIGDLEQNPTDLVSIADYTHLTAMLAPRPALLLYNEKDDCCFVAERAKPAVFDPLVPFYRLFDHEVDFEYYMNRQPGTHNYDRDNRQQFYRFVHKHYFPTQKGTDLFAEEIPSDDELFKQEELYAGLPTPNANFFTLAYDRLQSLPRHRVPTGDAPDAQWQEDARNRLRNVLRLEPVEAEAHLAQQKSGDGLKAEWYRVVIDGEWTVSAMVISKTPQNANSMETVIALSDGGRTELADWMREQVDAGLRVIAIDLALMGECTPEGISAGQTSMMLSTVGARPLGIQVGQLGAIIEWVCQQYETPKVSLYSQGWTAGVVCTVAAGLNPTRIDRIQSINALLSFKQLIEGHLDYEQYPTLFCFGLLEQFDMDELNALCPQKK
jgi:dienelactone hydrolase